MWHQTELKLRPCPNKAKKKKRKTKTKTEQDKTKTTATTKWCFTFFYLIPYNYLVMWHLSASAVLLHTIPLSYRDLFVLLTRHQAPNYVRELFPFLGILSGCQQPLYFSAHQVSGYMWFPLWTTVSHCWSYLQLLLLYSSRLIPCYIALSSDFWSPKIQFSSLTSMQILNSIYYLSSFSIGLFDQLLAASRMLLGVKYKVSEH